VGSRGGCRSLCRRSQWLLEPKFEIREDQRFFLRARQGKKRQRP
jgi:hypothetical protein